VTPPAVQQAEGIQADGELAPPIVDWWQPFVRDSYILEVAGELHGCIRIGYGRRGIWLQIWHNPYNINNDYLQQLLCFALHEIRRQPNLRLPVYVGVREYHGGVGPVLADFGFAPFTDRAKMAKQLLQWVKSAESVLTPVLDKVLDAVPEVVAAPFQLPDEVTGAGVSK